MPFICIYCNKEFTSKSILRNHQKSAKYCLKIQTEFNLIPKNKIEIEQKSYPCKHCGKSFSSKLCYQNHTDICVIKLKNTIEELTNKLDERDKKIENYKQQIKTIRLEVENEFYKEQSNKSYNMVEEIVKDNQSTINEIAKQPRVATTNNNHNKILINTPMDLSQPTVQLAIQNGFSDEYLVQGQKGVARFAYDNILKDEQGKLKYICTDAARQIFQFKNEDGSIQKDVKATKLTKALLEGELKSASHKMACDKMKDGSVEEFNMYTDNYYDIKDLETDNSDFSKELTTLTA